MRLLSLYLVSASLTVGALGQTPKGTLPSTNTTLAVSYNSTKVTPGITLPITQVQPIPTINHPSPANQTYQLLLVDLSISSATLNTSALVAGIQTPLTAGISANRTTRLHYWQTGLTFTTNGTLTNTTTPIAYYQPPAPPAGDIAHTYVFYLFQQTNGFAPPPAGNPFSQALVNQGNNRISFNVSHLATETGIGPLVGANYFLVQNTTGSTKATGSGTGTVSSPTAVTFRGGVGLQTPGSVGAIFSAIAIVLALLCII